MSTEQPEGGDQAVAADSPQHSNGTSNGESQRPLSPKSLFGNSAETPKEKAKAANGAENPPEEAMEVDEPQGASKAAEEPADDQTDAQEEPKEADEGGEGEAPKEEEEAADPQPNEDEQKPEVEAEGAQEDANDDEGHLDEPKEEEEPPADVEEAEQTEEPKEEQEEGPSKRKPPARPPKTPARSAKATPKTATPAVKAVAKSAARSAAKEVEEAAESSAASTVTPRRSSRNAKKAVAEEAQSTPADAKTPPVTSRAGHRSAARRKSVVIVEEEDEDEDEEEAEEKDDGDREFTPPPAPNAGPGQTPKTTGQVRKPKTLAARTGTRPTKTKARGRQNRYAKTEQAASRNSTQTTLTAATLNSSSTSLSALSTTPSARKDLGTPVSKRGGRKTKAEDDVFTPTASKSSTPARRKKQGESDVDLLPKKPKVEIKRPQLSAFDQKEADFVSHEPYPQGMRVFAMWGKEYYPAIVFDRDALGRYKVIFAEDEQNKDVPATGIIPLSKVTKGKQVAIIRKNDEGELEIPVEVVEVPSEDDAEEWAAGEFAIRDAEDEAAEVQRVPWTQLLITKLQQKDVMAVKNVVVDVVTDNVVPRSARRSRVAANTAIHEQQHPTQAAKSTPSSQRSAKSAGSSGAAPTPKTPTRTPSKRARAEEAADDESPKAKRKARGSKTAEKPIPEEDEQEEAADEEMETEEAEENDEKNLFSGYFFLLTSSARRPAHLTQFNKRECKLAIEERGGVVFEEIDEIINRPEGTKAFLIADSAYRTHKYLFALAASIPTVHHNFVEACLKEKKVVEHEQFLLPAGTSVVDNAGAPLGELMKDKTVLVHSVPTASQQQHVKVVPFAEVWRPLLDLLGAKIVVCEETEEAAVLEFMENNHYDFVLSDQTCLPAVIARAREKGAQAVSSNWIIHAIVTGSLASVDEHPSFSPLV
ncbi:Tumor suppressor p53-binding protein 1 [Aphelenchoides fujianensis]|nr:Tumor suppressor p53-binding protein 1 [Aphelenchoides fujianensis]